jgi:topoisomerase-4 subunit A
MVRMAQDFAQRYPLVDGQGNFGSIDGDECRRRLRLHRGRSSDAGRHADAQDIDEDTVDFRPTLRRDRPGADACCRRLSPNLLANGSQGIAVGMATSVPPHNLAEICDALLHLIKTPNARTETLLNYIQARNSRPAACSAKRARPSWKAYKTGAAPCAYGARWPRRI